MSVQINLDRSAMTAEEARQTGVFRMQITVTSVSGSDLIDTSMFLYQREVVDSESGEMGDTCLGVASIPDVAEYPLNAPDVSNTNQFFRKDNVDLVFRNTELGNEVWEQLKTSMENVRRAAEVAEVLNETESVTLS